MNEYRITFTSETGESSNLNITERTEAAARKSFNTIHRGMGFTIQSMEWFKSLERQIERNRIDANHSKRDELLKLIEFADQRPELDPTIRLAELASVDNAKFVELFEELLPKYRWRKNSAIYKLYLASKEGKVKEIKKEVFFEDANLTAYTEGDRAYIHFTMRPARQLIVALKSRKWWWNSGRGAWSTYLDRLDREWVAGISTQYAKYV